MCKGKLVSENNGLNVNGLKKKKEVEECRQTSCENNAGTHEPLPAAKLGHFVLKQTPPKKNLSNIMKSKMAAKLNGYRHKRNRISAIGILWRTPGKTWESALR